MSEVSFPTYGAGICHYLPAVAEATDQAGTFFGPQGYAIGLTASLIMKGSEQYFCLNECIGCSWNVLTDGEVKYEGARFALWKGKDVLTEEVKKRVTKLATGKFSFIAEHGDKIAKGIFHFGQYAIGALESTARERDIKECCPSKTGKPCPDTPPLPKIIPKKKEAKKPAITTEDNKSSIKSEKTDRIENGPDPEIGALPGGKALNTKMKSIENYVKKVDPMLLADSQKKRERIGEL